MPSERRSLDSVPFCLLPTHSLLRLLTSSNEYHRRRHRQRRLPEKQQQPQPPTLRSLAVVAEERRACVHLLFSGRCLYGPPKQRGRKRHVTSRESAGPSPGPTSWLGVKWGEQCTRRGKRPRCRNASPFCLYILFLSLYLSLSLCVLLAPFFFLPFGTALWDRPSCGGNVNADAMK